MSHLAPSGREDHGITARRVAGNTLYLSVVEAVTRVVSMGFVMIAARHLGREKFGVLSFAQGFISMFAVLTDFGLGFLATKQIARDRRSAEAIVRTGVTIRLAASAVVVGLIVLLVNLLGYPGSTVRVVYIYSVMVFVNALALFYGNVFQGFERMGYTAVGRAVQAVVTIAGALLLALGPPVVERYALVYVGAGVVSVGVMFVCASVRFVRPGFSFRVLEWFGTIRSSLPFALTVILVGFYYWNGTTLLSKLSGDEAVGIYSAAFRLVLGLGFLAGAFSGAIYPVMSRAYVEGRDQLQTIFERSFRYLLMLAIPLAVLGTVLARPVILLIYGERYLQSIAVFRLLVWWGACSYLNSVLSNYFFASNRQRLVVYQASIGLGANVLLNFLLIPRLAATGAAIALVVAEALGVAFCLFHQMRMDGRMRARVVAGGFVRDLAAATVAVPAAWFVSRWNGIAALFVGVFLYIALLLIVREVMPEDLELLRKILRGRRG